MDDEIATPLDSTDPLSLLIHSSPMHDNDDHGSPPDWSQLGALWPDQHDPDSNSKGFNEYLDFNMASGILDMDLDIPGGIEPSALHLDEPSRLGYSTYDSDSFTLIPPSASPADILAAQFPFPFNGDMLLDPSSAFNPTLGVGPGMDHLQTPNSKTRRLSVTSSSSASTGGPSFSPVPESLPSPGNGYTSDSSSTQPSSSPSADHSASSPGIVPSSTVTATTPGSANITTQHDFSGDPAAELAHRVRQSAGVMLAVPMNGNGTTFQPSSSQKLPIPRLQRPTVGGASPPKSTTPSIASSAASTPPPSTPPNDSVPVLNNINALPPTQAVVPRPKTSHTTIERRYRTNLNARIQSLRMAVPALRVLEDRDSGSSKKIKKNLKGGVLIKSSSSSPSSSGSGGPGTMIAVPGDPSNPYGEVDVVDERGYVDGVKVARKCSKANVLGKAVEYIRVLKRREMRLRSEQGGLKALVCGLVGGPALLREWEREWRERFGGEERDEVEGGDLEDDEDDEEDEDEDESAGKKRKRVKVEKDVLRGDLKPTQSQNVMLGADGQPEKRKRGRPRKVPVPAPAHTEQQPQQQQQYLLAVFALFSFFNSPLTSSSNPNTHTHQGHVISPPLAYAPEILSHLTPPPNTASTVGIVTWRDWVQVAHLAITLLLFVSVIARMGNGFGLGRVNKFVRGIVSGMKNSEDEEVEKKVEEIIIGNQPVPGLTSVLALYRSLPQSTSPIIKSLFLYTIASSPIPSPVGHTIKMRARALWKNSSSSQSTKHLIVLNTPIDEVYSFLGAIKPNKGIEDEDLVDQIAKYIIKIKLGRVLGKMFISEVTGGYSKDKKQDDEKMVVMKEEDVEELVRGAKELGGEVGLLARNVDRVRGASWSSMQVLEEDDEEGRNSESESDLDSESSTLSEESVMMMNGEDDDDDDEETNTPFTILRALVLYRSLFSSCTSTPAISIEPPTPTTPTPLHRLRRLSTSLPNSNSNSNNTTTTTTLQPTKKTTENEQRKKIYTLRKILGSRVFENEQEEEEEEVMLLEDARDRVVDMLVEVERLSRLWM